MIRFFYHPTPNPAKVALFLEESGMPYEVAPIDTSRGDQHALAFRKINPNGKVPAILDMDTDSGVETRVFDSTAILLYLAQKSGRFLGEKNDYANMLSWLMFVGTGLGPFSGQAVHFQFAAPESPYAINRFRREAERHYEVLNDRLADRAYIVGNEYTIVDMSAWGWVDRASRVLDGPEPVLAAYPNVERWFERIDSRPAAARARMLANAHAFKKVVDEEAKRALFPSNYPRER